MAQQIREVMTPDPICLPTDASVREAAASMRGQGVGDVLVVEGDRLRGIVTDRDLVVRALATRDDPGGTRLGEVCSDEVFAASPDEDVDAVITRMREHAVRRIPIVEDGRPVGVFSLGDAAMERDPFSALAEISTAPGNS